ncbi:RHS repeat-associated core domain-containing protein [Pseudomonas alloputida]|uniref:RHS repeat-associated core domain-containing protein n=1 Tax=Pseudomonas alloputida TaxID=1940621 RepID=UPI001E363870|nr:RHS repeat-associated core domain-containing protein [Pseudomonas alloputida]
MFAGVNLVLGEICEETHLLLAADRQNSILRARSTRCYSPYGFDQAASRESLLGYNGEHRDVASECDLLGSGVRAYSSMLMRFFSPDVISPFGAGGINAYAYCEGDPINYLDTDGRMKVPVIPSPWTSRQPYGVSWRSHAIQRAPKPTPTTLSAMSALVDTIPVNGSHPLYLKMAGRETSGGAVPEMFWISKKREMPRAGEFAKNMVAQARRQGVKSQTQISDDLLISAIEYKVLNGGGGLSEWGGRVALSRLKYVDDNSAQTTLRRLISEVVRSTHPEFYDPVLAKRPNTSSVFSS